MHVALGVEVGDRSGDLEHAKERARRELEPLGGRHEELARGGSYTAVHIDPTAARLGIARHTTRPRVARALSGSRFLHPRPDHRGRLATHGGIHRAWRDRADADVHVEPIDEWTGQAGLGPGDRKRGAWPDSTGAP